MGRWAQASRTGGGPTALNSIRSAVDAFTTEIDVNYFHPIGAASFILATFVSNPSAQSPISITQTATHTVQLAFSLTIAADTTLVYTGSVPNILTPQTVNH